MRKWLELHELPQPEGLAALLDTMEPTLTPADAAYVEKRLASFPGDFPDLLNPTKNYRT